MNFLDFTNKITESEQTITLWRINLNLYLNIVQWNCYHLSLWIIMLWSFCTCLLDISAFSSRPSDFFPPCMPVLPNIYFPLSSYQVTAVLGSCLGDDRTWTHQPWGSCLLLTALRAPHGPLQWLLCLATGNWVTGAGAEQRATWAEAEGRSRRKCNCKEALSGGETHAAFFASDSTLPPCSFCFLYLLQAQEGIGRDHSTLCLLFPP